MPSYERPTVEELAADMQALRTAFRDRTLYTKHADLHQAGGFDPLIGAPHAQSHTHASHSSIGVSDHHASTKIIDADGDTEWNAEASADEDILRAKAGGTELMTVGNEGAVEILHTAAGSNEHALELVVDDGGFGNVSAIDIDYITNAIVAGEDEEVILVNIDESLAQGGNVVALEVLATEGAATIHAIEAAALVGPVLQLSGTFADMDSALVKAVDRLTEFTTSDPGGANNIVFFVANGDTITIGDAAKFEEIEFLLDTVASKDCKIKFEFSSGAGPAYTEFFPADGTNGMRNTGVIAWAASDVTSWVAVGGEFLIRLTRTKGGSITSPIEDKVQIAAVVEYEWDPDGNLSINGLTAAGNIAIRSNSELRFYDNGNYVGFKAPALAGDKIWTLPDADGNASDFLQTNGSGTLSWAAAAGGGGVVMAQVWALN